MESPSTSLENPTQDSTVESNFENQSFMSHSKIENALREIRKTWVDSPAPVNNHRSFSRFYAELNVMNLVLREYANSENKNDENVLTAVYNYIVKAHKTYLKLIHDWINAAKAKAKQNISVTALPSVQKLLAQYNPSIEDKLRRYYNKVKMDPDDRSEASVMSPAPTTFTNIFAESTHVTQSARESDDDVIRPSNMIMKAKTRVEIEDRQRESPRNAALYYEKERMTEKFKEQTSLAETARTSTDVGSRKAFPQIDSLSSNDDIDDDPLAENKIYLMSSTKEAIRDSGNQGYPWNESLNNRLKADHESEAGFLFSRRTLIGRDVCSRSEHEGERIRYKPPERAHQPPPQVQELQHDAPEFVPWRTAGNKGFYKHPNWESDYTRQGNVNTRQSQGSNYCPNYPWNVSGGPKETQPGRYDYEQGQLDGRLRAKYSMLFEMGSKETSRKFSGRKADYQVFRQQLLRDYRILWDIDPYTLLQKIANSVTDSVYEHIRSAWVMRDPHEALSRIWEILEDLYGDPLGMFKNAIREIKWEKGSLTNKVSSLQTYRTKLRNLKSIAESINMEAELSNPKLLFRIVDCFNPALHALFVQEFRYYHEWRFHTVLQFINEQISNLQYRESHCYDISAIIDEEEKGRYKVHYPERNTTRARANNLNANATYEKPRPWKTPSYRSEGVPKEPKCYIHPSSNHQTVDCWQFLEKDVQQRRSFAREHGLCFYCLCKHYSADCLTKSRSVVCQGAHSKLLHLPVESPKRPPSRSNNLSKQERDESSTINSQPNCKINATKEKEKVYIDEPDCSSLVPLMALTAVKRNPESEEVEDDVKFYALVDTGADTSICTRELAESLIEWNPEDKITIQFLEKQPDEYNCMRETLPVRQGDGKIVDIPNISFIETTLPYKEGIPNQEIIAKYDLWKHGFPILNGEPRVDMILGAQEIRKFKIFEECTWKKEPRCHPLIGDHSLGPIFWGVEASNYQEDKISKKIILERDKKCLVGTKGPPFLLKPTESWEMRPNNIKASDNVNALKEIKRSVARLNHIQVKEKHHTLKNLSDSSTSTKPENRLIKLHECFNALRENPKTPSEIASCKNQVNIIEQTRMTLNYLKECLGCKLRLQVRGKQLMVPLPASKLKPRTHVFTYAASDLAGPFSVVVGRSTVKRWLCVFVCMVTTAVRIEVAADLSTSSFINAFRRFLCSTGF